MEIVFVSSDRDQKSFDEYYGEQPWLALPFDADDEKEELDSKFKVSGIPTLVILDGDGKTITVDGREAVSKDPTGAKFPWVPPSKAEKAAATLALLDSFVDKSGATFGKEKVAGKAMGLYFSAHWCPPCRAFTPKLAQYYTEGLKDKMEIVFVSSDNTKAEFDEYLAEQPWLALSYEKRDTKAQLSEIFGVQGIPSFCMFASQRQANCILWHVGEATLYRYCMSLIMTFVLCEPPALRLRAWAACFPVGTRECECECECDPVSTE